MENTKAVVMTAEVEKYNEFLHSILDIGELMVAVGGEISRVEDTLERLGHAYGGQEVSVFVITTHMMMTVRFPDGVELTQTRSVPSGGNQDYMKLEALNALSRECCEHPLGIEELRARIKAVGRMDHNRVIWYLSGMLLSWAFAMFFGGTFWDGLVSAGFALVVCLMQRKISNICPNNMIFCLLCSLVIGLGIGAVSRLVAPLHGDMIMIGDIMLLIPGLGITNAIRDVFSEDTLSGILRLVEAVLWAAALAAGFMISMGVIGGIA